VFLLAKLLNSENYTNNDSEFKTAVAARMMSI